MRDLTDTAVVITGASSGVGRATARAFARRGARLALAARGEGPLREAAAECDDLGGDAIAVPTDVADPEAVHRLAATAANTFGSLDVWVNNAGVGVIGRYTDVPLEAHRRVIETNLLGIMNGAYAALPHFFEQGHGVLINNISIGGYVPSPYAASYAASKFAARAFTDSLRRELDGWPDIHVSAVYPFFMDTPGVQHGANYTGRVLKPAPPLYAPETTAEVIVHLAERPRREVVVGVMAKLARLQYALVPRLVEWGAARFIELYLRQAEPSDLTDGNLHEPMPRPMAVHGGWRWPVPRSPTAVGTLAAVGLAAAAGVAAAGLLAARR